MSQYWESFYLDVLVFGGATISWLDQLFFQSPQVFVGDWVMFSVLAASCRDELQLHLYPSEIFRDRLSRREGRGPSRALRRRDEEVRRMKRG